MKKGKSTLSPVSRSPNGKTPLPQNRRANQRTLNNNNSQQDLQGALNLFFELRDRKYKDIVEMLFQYYDFPSIAKGIYDKYHILPIGWEQDLKINQQRYPEKMDWFKPTRMKYLQETTDQYPPVDRNLHFPERSKEVDKVVDEFIINEKDYQNRIQTFVSTYVAEVQAISTQKVGPRAAKALGLSAEQVNFIFGRNLHAVKDVGEVFMIRLEALSLVKAEPKGGRPKLLAKIVQSCADTLLQAYGPYNASYNVSKRLLEQTQNTLRLNRSMNGGGSQRDFDELTSPHLNFVELWEEIKQAKPVLKTAATIDSVLMTPIRRFTNYILLLERIQKKMEEGMPGKDNVSRCIQFLKECTTKIDLEVKNQSNLDIMGTNLLGGV